MAPSFAYNNVDAAAAGTTAPEASGGRVASVYSEVQTSRIDHALPLPSVLTKPFQIVDGPPSSAAGNPDEIAKLFPNLFGQPSAMLVPSSSAGSGQKLKIGVVLSGGQAPGGHNVISGIFDYLQDHAKGSTLYGFRGGPAGVMKGKYVELNTEFIYPYRNQGGFDMICSGRDKIETPEQFKQAEETALKLDLDGLVVIGGDDSNTNACLLAENFRGKNLKTRVIGCPKTIDGDLKSKEVPISFGFDTACKIYSEMIGNVMIDARSTGKLSSLSPPISRSFLYTSMSTTVSSSFPNPNPSPIPVPAMAQSFPPNPCSDSEAEPEPEPSSESPISNSVSPTLLHLSFNQDSGCFATGTDHGFRIYNCDPFREIFRRDFDSGGVGVVEMLFRCNILALVGGGPDPQYPLNKVMIWDDHQSRCIGELSFRSEVKAVRLRRDRIIVLLLQKIFVYNFADLKLLHQIETIANPKGLCVVSHVSGPMVLACPGLQKGQVRVEHYGSKRTKFIMAHDSRIASFALTQDGRLLATSSSKGTLVRVFNTLDGSLLQEVRRGADRAEIYSLAFSSTAQWLAVSSDKGTVHVFNLKVDSGSLGVDRPRTSSEANLSTPSGISSLSFIRGVLPRYFSSEWSVAQFRLQEGLRYIVAFGHQKNTVVILGMDGSFHRCQFDPESGGEMTQLEYYNFLKPEETF